jgi:hypothetical protein
MTTAADAFILVSFLNRSETPTRKFSSDEAERDGLFSLLQATTKLLNRNDRIRYRAGQRSPSIALGSVEVGDIPTDGVKNAHNIRQPPQAATA